MAYHHSPVKVAVVQASPVLFDRGATVEKACRLICEAAAQGVQLIWLGREAATMEHPVRVLRSMGAHRSMDGAVY